MHSALDDDGHPRACDAAVDRAFVDALAVVDHPALDDGEPSWTDGRGRRGRHGRRGQHGRRGRRVSPGRPGRWSFHSLLAGAVPCVLGLHS